MTITTIQEVKRAERRVQNIENLDPDKKHEALIKFAEDYKVHCPIIRNNEEFRNELVQNIHTFLQTKMMLIACVSAKRSCRWAAVAAIVACIAVVVANWSTLVGWALAIIEEISSVQDQCC